MTAAPVPEFELPDTIAALPRRGFEFSPGTPAAADEILSQPAHALFQRLLRDQESEAVLLTARRVLHAFLRPAAAAASPTDTSPADSSPADVAGRIAAEVGRVRSGLAETIESLLAA